MLQFALDLPDLLVGWVRATGVRVADAPAELTAEIEALAADPERQGLTPEVQKAVRDLLRGHGYKPAGRGKPASEFLVRAAREGRFPHINNLVDINNLMSLQTGWPISILDVDRAGTESFELRHGRPDESYVFNDAGHRIDLAGLLCVARPGGEPFGNPVKDSMDTKLEAGTRRVLALLYTSRQVADIEAVRRAADRFGALVARHAAADQVDSGVAASGVGPAL